MKATSTYILPALILFVFVWYCLKKRHQLDLDHAIVIGRVIGWKFVPKSGGDSKLMYVYASKRQGDYLIGELNLPKNHDAFVDRSFPVAFSPSDSDLSVMLLLPEDFERFGYPFPDSLKWVLQYIDK